MVTLIVALMEHPEHVAEVTSCLESAGHKVCIIDSFAKAKESIQEHPVDLILSDVHLENGGSVFDFLRWVREDRRLQSVPFVLFSLEPSKLAKFLADAVHTTARQLGASKYVSMQQFDPVLLSQEVAQLLPGNRDTQVLTKQE